MSDLSSLAAKALQGELVEEYQVGKGTQRVRRGMLRDQVDAALKLQKIQERSQTGLCVKARFNSDRCG